MPRPLGWERRGWSSVVVCASGPSFDDAQARAVVAARAAGFVRVIAVNDQWRAVPNADVLYACDGNWWHHYIGEVRGGFAGELWTQHEPLANKFGLRVVNNRRRPGLTTLPGCVHSGGNSGYQAINLAYLFGAERIALVGFDMQKATDGRSHNFGEHPGKLNRGQAFPAWIEKFRDLARDLQREGVAVANCSPSTALRCFERADLGDTLHAWSA